MTVECMNHPEAEADPNVVEDYGVPLCSDCAWSAILPDRIGAPGFLARAIAACLLEQGQGGLVAMALDTTGDAPAVRTNFVWRRHAPWQVELVFRSADTGLPEDITWLVGRLLMARGLVADTGPGGDVRVCPTGATKTHITLTSPEGSRVFVFLAERLGAFLASTLDLIPFGAEQLGPAVDELIARCLAEGDREAGR
jgi:hypothetical protein